MQKLPSPPHPLQKANSCTLLPVTWPSPAAIPLAETWVWRWGRGGLTLAAGRLSLLGHAQSAPFLLCCAAPRAPAAWAQRALCGGDGICQAAAVRLRAPLHSALLRGRSRPSAARRQSDPRTLCGASDGGRSAGSPERQPTSLDRAPALPTRPLPTRRALHPAGAAGLGLAPSSSDSW